MDNATDPADLAKWKQAAPRGTNDHRSEILCLFYGMVSAQLEDNRASVSSIVEAMERAVKSATPK